MAAALLPLELLEKIARNLSTKADLRSFLLASTAWCSAALSPLYENITIDLRRPEDEISWLMMLDERNKGLERIRKVAFGEVDEDDEYLLNASSSTSSKSSQNDISMPDKVTVMYKLAERLLDLVPRNTIHEIRPPLSHNPPVWYQQSFSIQREVRCIHLRPLTRNWTDNEVQDVVASLPASFDKCIRLEVFPEDGADLTLIAAVAHRVQKIQELVVRPDPEMYSFEAYREMRWTMDSLVMDTLEARLLCSSLYSLRDKTFPALRSLILVSVSLQDSAEVYARYLPLDTLDHLELQCCDGSAEFLDDLFMGDLIKHTRLSNLWIEDSALCNSLVEVMEDVLLKIDGLKVLRLTICHAPRQLCISRIWRHIPSLECVVYEGDINIRVASSNLTEVSAVWPPEDLEKLEAEIKLRSIRYSLPRQKVRYGLASSCGKSAPRSFSGSFRD